jgi:hypothetical protein
MYGAIAIAAAVTAYFAIFTQFAPYDDEGTLLVTLKAFVHGGTLYRDIYSEYGPFYYELFGGFFALTGHAVTTDASRTLVIALWLGTSFLFGLAAQRLSGQLLLGGAGMIVAFGVLRVLVSEPMHPQGLCVLLVGALALLIASSSGARSGWSGAAAGAVVAALVSTKVNLGGFAVAAIALAAVMTVAPLHRRRWLRWGVLAAFLAMPVVTTGRDLGAEWVRNFVLLEMLAAAALIAAAWPGRPRRGASDRDLSAWLLAACAGFAIAFVAILAAILVTGPTLSDVYDGAIREAIRVRDVLVLPLPLPGNVVDWGVAAVAASALVAMWRSERSRPAALLPGLLRIGVGLVVWYSIARIAPIGLSPASGSPVTVPLLLAWVAAVPPAGSSEPDRRRFARIFFAALAIAESLQVYPVPGSQMGIAAVTYVPVGAICLGDGLTQLRRWAAERDAHAVERLRLVVGVAVVALFVELGLDLIARPAATEVVAYRHQPALPFPGATQLRLPTEEAEAYEKIVALLHRHRCTTFVGYPNVDSLYLWSGIEAPPPAAPGAWIKALDAERQQRVVDEVRSSPRPCAIRSQDRAEGWLAGGAPPDTPLVRYILDDFEPVASAKDIQFMLPKDGAQRARRRVPVSRPEAGSPSRR